MNLSKWETVFVRIETLSFSRIVDELSEPFILKNTLNPMIIPFLESAGGSCHDAETLVEVIAVTVKLLGASEGAEIKRIRME